MQHNIHTHTHTHTHTYSIHIHTYTYTYKHTHTHTHTYTHTHTHTHTQCLCVVASCAALGHEPQGSDAHKDFSFFSRATHQPDQHMRPSQHLLRCAAVRR